MMYFDVNTVSMKQLFILLLIVSYLKPLRAQQPDSSQINKSLEVVIQHLPSGLADFKGDLVNRRAQTSRFDSKLVIPGTSETIITEQAAFGRKHVSWRTVIFKGTNAAEAAATYTDIFNQINNAIIRSISDKPYILTGKYKMPSGNKTTASRFQLLPSTGEMKDVKVDLILEETNGDFTVSLNVHH
jgi:hypothetical protein